MKMHKIAARNNSLVYKINPLQIASLELEGKSQWKIKMSNGDVFLISRDDPENVELLNLLLEDEKDD